MSSEDSAYITLFNVNYNLYTGKIISDDQAEKIHDFYKNLTLQGVK
jgi:hypothetical protein